MFGPKFVIVRYRGGSAVLAQCSALEWRAQTGQAQCFGVGRRSLRTSTAHLFRAMHPKNEVISGTARLPLKREALYGLVQNLVRLSQERNEGIANAANQQQVH